MTRDEALAHFGKKGMKWGVTNKSTGSTDSGLKKKIAGRISSITPNQKKAAIILTSTGAVVAASILAGPIGGMVASGLSRAVSIQSTSSPLTAGKFNNHNNWQMIDNGRGELVPNPDYKG